jgi:hypothetical protein
MEIPGDGELHAGEPGTAAHYIAAGEGVKEIATFRTSPRVP